MQNAQAAATEALVAALAPVAPVLGAWHRVDTRETCGLPGGSMADERALVRVVATQWLQGRVVFARRITEAIDHDMIVESSDIISVGLRIQGRHGRGGRCQSRGVRTIGRGRFGHAEKGRSE